MAQRWIIVCGVFLASLAVSVLSLVEGLYLRRGYSIGVSLDDEPATPYAVVFPAWRLPATVLIAAVGVVAAALFVGRSKWAANVAWAAFACAVGVSLFDVRQYGTAATPTSMAKLVLLLLLAVFATVGRSRDA